MTCLATALGLRGYPQKCRQTYGCEGATAKTRSVSEGECSKTHGWLICEAARFVGWDQRSAGPPSLDQMVGRRCAGPTLPFLQSDELAGRAPRHSQLKVF